MEFISLENIQAFAHQYGYLAVFIGILLENLGLPIPGETITLVGGFLAGSKELNYWIVLGCAIAGATLGGNFGYLIGRYGGWQILTKFGSLVRMNETKLYELKEKVSQNAGKTVFFGRFIALFRVFASPLAGIVEMPYPKFMLYNFAGATAWAGIMVTLSFFLGEFISLEKLVAWVAKFAVLALIIIAAWLIIPFWLESRQNKETP